MAIGANQSALWGPKRKLGGRKKERWSQESPGKREVPALMMTLLPGEGERRRNSWPGNHTKVVK